MSAPQERSFELSALMDLRLAFGPGTRLWALRSREELCYDWLYFKASQANASFRDFAIQLYAHERENALEGMSMREIRKRIAVVLRAYRIRKRKRPSALVAVGHRPEPAQVKVLNGTHRACQSREPRSSSRPSPFTIRPIFRSTRENRLIDRAQ